MIENDFSLQGKIIADGKYRVEELIGKGAFAYVYRVRHLRLDIDRALKVLHRDWSEIGSKDIRNFRDRFEMEAQLLARIHKNGVQPHVIQVFDVNYDEQSGILYQEMEYASGGNLGSLIQKCRDDNQFIPLYTALKWGIEASQGLASLHKIDIVHRDVKPANILLGADGMVKIADLGLAQTPGSRIGPGSMAADHPGTTEYMPPEQLPGQKMALRTYADVYAMGCVLFEALTGRIYYHHSGERVSALRSDVPNWLDELVAQCVLQAAEGRPRDGLQLADLLRSGEKQQRHFDQIVQNEKIDGLKRLVADALKRQDWGAALKNVEELRLFGPEGQSAAEQIAAQINQDRQRFADIEKKRLADIAARKTVEQKRLEDSAEKELSAGKYKNATDFANQLKALGPETVITAERLLAKISAAELDASEQARLQHEQHAKQIRRLKQLAETAMKRNELNTAAGLIDKLLTMGHDGEKAAKELQDLLTLARQDAHRRDQKAAVLKWQSLLKSKAAWVMLLVVLLAAAGFGMAPRVIGLVGDRIVEMKAQKTAFAMITQTYDAMLALPTNTLAGNTPKASITPSMTPTITPTFTLSAIHTATETPVPSLTWTPLPTNTNVPPATNTARPAATNPPVYPPTNTPRPPIPTHTAVPPPTKTPLPPDPTKTPVPPPTKTPVPPPPTVTPDVRPPTPTPP